MRLVTFKSEDLKKYTVDKEMLQKAGRPCALLIRLKYKGMRYDFAVPLRSNINPSTPKRDYFPLPPRSSTKPNHRHGVHYSKMFPVDRAKANLYRTDGNTHAALIKNILDNNEKQIIADCHAYLKRYESGDIPKYATDIDKLIQVLCGERGYYGKS